MGDLRWILFIAGLVILAIVYLYSKYRASQPKESRSNITERREPAFGGVPQPASSDPEPDEPLSVDTDEETQQKVITIRLLATGKTGFPAEETIIQMRKAGLRHGQYGIFHRHPEQDETKCMYSIASLAEPGSFNLSRMKVETYPGISLFLVMPGAVNALDAFDDMIETGKTMAKNLNGELVDEQGSTLSIQRERFLREEVIRFEHQHSG